MGWAATAVVWRSFNYLPQKPSNSEGDMKGYLYMRILLLFGEQYQSVDWGTNPVKIMSTLIFAYRIDMRAARGSKTQFIVRKRTVWPGDPRNTNQTY